MGRIGLICITISQYLVGIHSVFEVFEQYHEAGLMKPFSIMLLFKVYPFLNILYQKTHTRQQRQFRFYVHIAAAVVQMNKIVWDLPEDERE